MIHSAYLCMFYNGYDNQINIYFNLIKYII